MRKRYVIKYYDDFKRRYEYYELLETGYEEARKLFMEHIRRIYGDRCIDDRRIWIENVYEEVKYY